MDMDISIIEKQIEQLLQSLPEVSQGSLSAEKSRKTVQQEIASQLDLTERAVEAHFYRTMKLLKKNYANSSCFSSPSTFLNNC